MASLAISLSGNGLTIANSSYNFTNTTFNSKVALPLRNEELAAVEIVVQSFIFIFAVLGNTVVVMSLVIQRHEWTRMHLMMLHLCFADLFVAFGSVLPQLLWDITFVFKGGNILCKIIKYMQIVAIYASSYVLLTTAIDRYFAICHPFISHQWSMTRVHRMVLVAWVLSLFFSIPQVFIFSYELNSYGMDDCWATFYPEWTLTLYITCFTALVYIIPSLILAFCYVSICVTVWRNPNVSSASDFRTRRKGISHAKMKTIKLTLAVVLCYLLCWSPFFIAQMWAVYDEKAPFYGKLIVQFNMHISDLYSRQSFRVEKLNTCNNDAIHLFYILYMSAVTL